MKKVTLITLLILFALFLCVTGETVANEEENVAAVRQVLEVIKTKDTAVLGRLMRPNMAQKIRQVFEKLWAMDTKVEAYIRDIFAKRDRVAVDFSLMGVDDSCRGVEWSVNFVSFWFVMKGKVAAIEGGDKFLGDLFEKEFDLKPAKTPDFKGKVKWTMGDLVTLGHAIRTYSGYNDGKLPKADSIKGLTKLIAPKYISMVPLRDQFGNYLIYKSDGKNYWLASSGSDGKFRGFNQKGFWDRNVDKGQDIIIRSGEFVLGPDIPSSKAQVLKDKRLATMSDLKTAGTSILAFKKMNDGKLPKAKSILELAALLQPRYVRGL
ncbi:hypothetical protein ACFLRB_04545, partial [Acidobacteriota bacterium]